MLKSDDFPQEHLKTLTDQINNWLGDMIQNHQLRMDPGMDLGSFELGEQFLMACLNDRELRDVNSLDKDLSKLVELTGRRHHQLKHNKEALAYARSLVCKNEALCQLFATKLAPRVQKAIEWLDKEENEFPEFAQATWRVRLVTIPTFHTHAFLIEQLENGSDVSTGESYISVVSAPSWLPRLEREKLFRTREFLLAFESKTPIFGVSGHADVSATV